MNTMQRMQGMTLLEIVLAMVIFVIGMLALAHLQTNLTRSNTDANLRTVATNVGEQVMESLRNFQRLSTDPDPNPVFAFAEIDEAYVNRIVHVGKPPPEGLDYVVTSTVKGYDFDPDRQGVSITGNPAVTDVIYDFKLVALTVSWDNNAEFIIDSEGEEGQQVIIGTHSISLSALIPSSPPLASAKIAAEDDGELGGIPVDYAPGLRPEIVAINLLDLQNNKFKESLTPQPDVIRRDEFVETWFEVVTYNYSNPDAIFLRREEFLVVSCQCKLHFPSGGADTGFLPTIWSGVDYTEGEFVSKPYGEGDSNQQSDFCDTCCRDHHDGASGMSSDDQIYDPVKTWTGGSNTSDHEHYAPGGVTLVTSDGDSYVEVCRMVRKDGFMRVAQDFRQEGFVAFPADYLDESSEVADYSGYVTDTVMDYYENPSSPPPPELTAPPDMAPPYVIPASTSGNATTLPTSGGDGFQQLRSRAIYIDHLGVEAKMIVDCMAGGLSGDDCGAPGADHYMEVFPFFEIQTTWLSWWIENSGGNPVEVSNQPLEDDNAHSRGVANKTGTGQIDVEVKIVMHRGNMGIAVVDAIDPYADSVAAATASYDLYVDANGGGGPPISGPVISGTFKSNVGGVNATGATIIPATGTSCSRIGDSLSCTTDSGNSTGSITITGYYKNAMTDLWICPSNFNVVVSDVVSSGLSMSTTLTWSNTVDQTGIMLKIENTSC